MRFDRRISLPGFTGPKLNIMTRTYHELQELNPDCGRSTGVDSLTSIRHTLRALASESGPRDALDKVRLLRPLVTKARDILRKRFESGDSPEANLRHRARFADSIVIGLLHIASISKGIRDGSMVAPLAAIAVGAYGRRELTSSSELDLLFLIPESSSSFAGNVAPATRECIGAVVASLWDLGFEPNHATRSVKECLELAQDDQTVLDHLVDRRHLWGCYGLFAALDTELGTLRRSPG